MYAIKHVTDIIEFSTSNLYVEEGAICIEIPDGTYPKANHLYDIRDGKLVDIDCEIPFKEGAETESEDLG